jgi:glucokinase
LFDEQTNPLPVAHDPAASAPVAMGIEIGEHAMRMTATLSTDPHAPHWQARLSALPTPEDALDALDDLIARALRENGTTPATMGRVAIGVALWDGADAARGVVRRMRYVPGWEDFPLAERLAQRWGGPVRLASTTDVAALAEAHLGAGQGAHAMLYLLLARSVWSAYVVEGQLVPGAHGMAGRLAHWRVRTDGPRCSCGMYGHLEPLTSAQALVRNMIGRAAASDESTAAMLGISGGRAEAMTARAVIQLAEEGDAAAEAVVADALDALAPVLANLVATFDPDAIVLGGPLADAGEYLFSALNARVAALCESFGQAPTVVPGQLEPYAPLIGARLLVEGG